MVKRRSGAMEEELRRDVEEAEAVVVEERVSVVGSRELWRWRRFESITRNH